MSQQKIYQTTLEGMENISDRRMDGSTTRLIDNAIQIIFSGKVCVCLDHWEMGRSQRCNKYLFGKILDRMQFEHNLGMLIKEKKIKIDKLKLTIELIN